MKGSHKNRPLPIIELTQPYASSINVDRLMEKIREWEIWADTQKKEIQEYMDGIPNRRLPLGKNAWLQEWEQMIKEILG